MIVSSLNVSTFETLHVAFLFPQSLVGFALRDVRRSTFSRRSRRVEPGERTGTRALVVAGAPVQQPT
jgi:hypothetical protein